MQEVWNLQADDTHTYIANGIITHNTAGDDESDFQGAAEIVYNPKGYRMYALPNVFDKEGQGRMWITFFFVDPFKFAKHLSYGEMFFIVLIIL